MRNFHPGLLVIAGLITTTLPTPAQETQKPKDDHGPLYRFVNRTGKFSDKECFWSLNNVNDWHSFADNPSAPCPLKNGRLFFYVGKTPPKNQGDRSTCWDFIEYASNLSKEGPAWHGNTTQVDAFCLPITVQMGNKIVGNTGPRTTLFEQFRKEAPEPFKACVIDDKWIVSPCATANFRKGGPNADYFKAYIDEVWAMYAEEKKTPSGKWIGKVEGDTLTFKAVNGGKTYSCKAKPSTQDAFQGTGVLATNPRFCGAINRHVLADPADWDTSSAYYKAEPCNWYAKFLHEHSIDHKAYGFCYDDDGGQAAFFSATGPELTVTLYWDTPPAVK
jgi:hypothetical protein